MAFFAEDNGGAGVLATGQLAGGGHHGVLQVGIENEAIVIGGLGVAELFTELAEMGGAKEEGDINECLPCEQLQGLRLDFKKCAARKFDGGNVVFG